MSGAANFPDASISILTEGLSANTGQDDGRIAELARAFALEASQRVLPVAGLGPIANTRDLLHMRGIDLAVVDADILAFAKLDRRVLGASFPMSQVLRLGDKTVYVVAGPDRHALADLSHQKVLALGQDSDGVVTARTVFALLGIDMQLGVAADLAEAAGKLADRSAAALVLVARPGDVTLAPLPKDKGLHLVPIPASDALDKVYDRITVSQAEAAGLAPAEGVSSLRVASLLATYDWQPNQVRFVPAQQFLRALPAVLAGLRKADGSGFWQSVDTRSAAPGWQIYDGAAAALASVAPATATPRIGSAIAAAPLAPAVAAAPPISAAGRPGAGGGGIDLVGYPLAGLADPKAPGGGLIAELVSASLGGAAVRVQWASGARDAADKLQSGTGARLGLVRPQSDCDAPAATGDCDGLILSKPLFRALDVFFVRRGSDFQFRRDDDVAGRSICAAHEADVAVLDRHDRRWLKQEMITLLRRQTLADCFLALQRGDVDAVLGDDLAGREQIAAARLDDQVEALERPVGLREIDVAAAKSDPDAATLIGRVDAGLAALQAQGRYAAIVLARLKPVPPERTDEAQR